MSPVKYKRLQYANKKKVIAAIEAYYFDLFILITYNILIYINKYHNKCIVNLIINTIYVFLYLYL